MAFIADKEELKPGLVIFRRTDVAHRNWYCRIKLPEVDRYKTVSLKTPDITTARQKAFRQDVEVQICLERDIPVFNRPFCEVAAEYVAFLKRRAAMGEITPGRVKIVESMIKAQLNRYVGSTQIHLIGHDRWENYRTWRRENGEGRIARAGQTRPLTDDEAKAASDAAETKAKATASRYIPRRRRKVAQADAGPPKKAKTHWVYVSDATISTEMKLFSAIMNFAAGKRYIPAANKFGRRPKLKTERRDEFTLEEYRKLHTVGRSWIKASGREASQWSREVAYNFMLIMCNTGMRPPEAANLRWRDITPAKDKEGRPVFVMYVRGKGKERKLVAPASVGEYLDRVRKLSKSTEPDDRVFTNHQGSPAKTLYSNLIEKLFDKAGVREGPSGTPRSTYSFRHTYATLRLSQGIDVYFLAEQMGTSVKMIEDHYGHVNTIKHADRILQGIGGWDPIQPPPSDGERDAKAAKAVAVKQPDRERSTRTKTRH